MLDQEMVTEENKGNRQEAIPNTNQDKNEYNKGNKSENYTNCGEGES